MNRIDIVLDLVRKGVITDEQAKALMEKEKEYVYYPSYPSWNYWQYPYLQRPYTITYTNGTGGYAQNALSLTTTGTTATTALLNNDWTTQLASTPGEANG